LLGFALPSPPIGDLVKTGNIRYIVVYQKFK
jgi:hypothetical protein